MVAPDPGYVLREGDILVIEAEPESLASVLSTAGLRLEEDVSPEEEERKPGSGGDRVLTCTGSDRSGRTAAKRRGRRRE